MGLLGRKKVRNVAFDAELLFILWDGGGEGSYKTKEYFKIFYKIYQGYLSKLFYKKGFCLRTNGYTHIPSYGELRSLKRTLSGFAPKKNCLRKYIMIFF